MKRTLEHPAQPLRIAFVGAGREHDAKARYGPIIRNHDAIHLITEGRAHYRIGELSFPVHAGQCVYLPADTPLLYYSDADDICTTDWVNFRGDDVPRITEHCGLTTTRPLADVSSPDTLHDIVTRMLDCSERSLSTNLRLVGLMDDFLGTLVETSSTAELNVDPKANAYITQAVQYIQDHMGEPLRVSDVADALFISRAYLYTLFQDFQHTTPQLFITKAKLYQACELLRTTREPIRQIAEDCGYRNVTAFSKAFRRIIAMSPREYRQHFTDPDHMAESWDEKD
ncbi:AraC family transcriptional regulator [Bifidobacterium ramosum]|uniref:AraC family transcriptional regulator n=1 Tax=Bifidobacterium ramosum TaxID=1798158 RepID=A0A6L4WY70_9BIFI|nr:AraC family transcriptional regulator [Bifidobacterium ramosum]KAB8287209.1 AraC family transcriptional regulator [Bifidobacterium ramosum]NEG71921.1 helix-turn-helix domain-containing protein [Bifidobacterium ramosum]